ncbi:MAG: hypothetical protein ACRESR_03540 [Gammaproteobacteria bacterium]
MTFKMKPNHWLIVAVVSAAAPVLLAGAISLLPGEAQAASCRSSHSPDLARILSFAAPSVSKLPGGWAGKPPGTGSLNKTRHHGYKVVLLSRGKKSASKFSFIASCVQSDFSGKTITLKAFLRTEDVSKLAGLSLREDGEVRTLAGTSTHDRNLHGTTGWKEYSISVPVKPQARRVAFAAFLSGTGKVWVSHVQLLADGKPIWEAPKVKLKETVLAPITNSTKAPALPSIRSTKFR